MTLEEAKRLKTGDRVLVEATIRELNNHMPEDGNIYIALNVVNLEHDEAWSCVRYEDIREKVVPQRRRFKAGDVVLSRAGRILLVRCNEEESPTARLVESFNYHYNHHEINTIAWDELTLVCAVGNREDRKEGEV